MLFSSPRCVLLTLVSSDRGVPAPRWQAGPQREGEGKSLCCFSFPFQGLCAPQRTQPSGQCPAFLTEACPSAHDQEPKQERPLPALPWKQEAQGPLKRLLFTPHVSGRVKIPALQAPDSAPTDPTKCRTTPSCTAHLLP